MDRFIDALKISIPGCPSVLLKNETLRAAIRFCEETWIWQSGEDVSVGIGETNISPSIPSNSRLIGAKVLRDTVNVYRYSRSADVLTLDDSPSQETTFSVTAYLAPTRTATSLPNFLYLDWFEAIEAGAQVGVLMIPGKPWSNPSTAAVKRVTYLHHMGEAKIKSKKKNDQTELVVTRRPFV